MAVHYITTSPVEIAFVIVSLLASCDTITIVIGLIEP